MQHTSETSRIQKNRYSEHYCRVKKPHEIDSSLYKHFKQLSHSLT